MVSFCLATNYNARGVKMPVIIEGKEYVTTREAATLLKVSHGRVRQLVRDGVLTDKIQLDPRRTLVSLEQVKEYDNTRRKYTKAPHS